MVIHDAEKLVEKLRALQNKPGYKWNGAYHKGVSDSIGVVLGMMDQEEEECEST